MTRIYRTTAYDVQSGGVRFIHYWDSFFSAVYYARLWQDEGTRVTITSTSVQLPVPVIGDIYR